MATKGKWNRVGSILQQLDRTWKEMQLNLKSSDTEHVEALKASTAKLLDVLCTKDKSCKDFLNKHSNVIPQLFEILKFSVAADQQITINIIDTFNHVISQGKGMNILLGAGVVRMVTECIVSSASSLYTTSGLVNEELFISLYSLLLKLASKDKRFSTISRIAGGVEVAVSVLKHFSSHGKIAGMVIQVMKTYTTSVVNCGIMVKSGIVSLTLRMINGCGQKKILLLKNLLDLLASLCKTKAGAKKCVNQNVIPLMLAMYQESHRYDHRNRNTSLRRAILTVIKACVAFTFGCKSFLAANGYRTLYFLGLEALDSREMESCLRIIILILRKCTRNNKLPLDKLSSTYSFDLPDASNKENFFGDDEDAGCLKSEDQLNEESSDADSVGYDDIDLDVSPKKKVVAESENDCAYIDDTSGNLLSDRDLEPYKVFFEELFCSQSSDDGLEDNSDDFIRIPTASLDDNINVTEDSREDLEDDSCNHMNSLEDISPDLTSSDLKRRTLSESNIFYKKLQSLSLQDEYSNMHTEYKDLHDMSTYIPNGSNLLTIDHDNNNVILEDIEKFTQYKDVKKKLTNLSYQPDTYKKCIDSYSLHSYIPCEKTENDRSSTPIEVADLPEVKSVCPFIQTALPDVFGHLNHTSKRLLNKKSNIQRLMLFQDFSRHIFPEQLISRVVYDLDKLLMDSDKSKFTPSLRVPAKSHTLKKSQSVPRFTSAKRRQCMSVLNGSLKVEGLQPDHLIFESRFESGNLRRVIHIRQYEYDLILNADVNTDHHHQWFYFQVEKMEAGVQYRFNIINCEKPNSQFNFGMQPVCYSSKRAMEGSPHWERTGSDVCYYKNYYIRGGKISGKYYHTATFSIRFPYANDTCYLSYHYPFTLTMLNVELQKLEASLSPYIYYKNQVLCQSLGGNNVNLITITNVNSSKYGDIMRRPYIVLTCRVHPGESNSSWIMKGILDFLVSCDENASELRSLFIFKIIPMLNPDGVVNGCHRCSLSGQDLNRQWKAPDENLHPSIYHAKGILELMISLKKRPLVFVDFHGHSRKKNVFLYGCGGRKSKTAVDDDSQTPCNSNDSDSPNTLDNDLYSGNDAVKMLPRIMSNLAPCFSLQTCNFAMEKSKEATARIVGFKELGITHCFTMESTYSGMDQGLYKGAQIGTRELEEMGWHFCLSLLKFGQAPNVRRFDEAEIT